MSRALGWVDVTAKGAGQQRVGHPLEFDLGGKLRECLLEIVELLIDRPPHWLPRCLPRTRPVPHQNSGVGHLGKAPICERVSFFDDVEALEELFEADLLAHLVSPAHFDERVLDGLAEYGLDSRHEALEVLTHAELLEDDGGALVERGGDLLCGDEVDQGPRTPCL